MDLFSLLRTAARRWWVVLPILAGTLLFAASLMSNRAVEYSASGSQLVVASPSALGASNPTVPSTLIAGVVADLMTSSSVRTDVTEAGLSSSYAVGVDELGTILEISVTASSATEAAETAAFLAELAPELARDALGDRAIGYELRSIRQPTADDAVSSEGEFRVTSPVIVIPQGQSQTNPFPATLGTVRSLLEVARTAEVAIAVGRAAPSARYVVSSELRDAAPIVRIGVVADSSEDAISGYSTVLDQLRQQLASLQSDAGVQEVEMTALRDLATPTAAFATDASVVRPVAGVVVLGLGAALAAAVLADTVLVLRSTRRHPDRRPHDEPVSTEAELELVADRSI